MKRRVADKTHNWVQDGHSERVAEQQRKRVEEGTHHFVTNNPQTTQDRVDAGTHIFLVDHPLHKPEILKKFTEGVRRRVKDGTHNFISNHPLKDSEIRLKQMRTHASTRLKKRKEAGQQFWCDMGEGEEE